MTIPGRPALKSEGLTPGLRVGLYGGSFDPPHMAHSHVARTAMRRLGLDRVWWLISPGNPFKPHQPASLENRIASINAMVPEPRMVPSGIEDRLPSNRTAEVIAWMQMRYPCVSFVWIMGADGFAELHRWQNWEDIAARVPICVISRPGWTLKALCSPAAKRLAKFRVPESQARTVVSRVPGWTYLTERLHPHSSRALRAKPAA
jgi:nicotinate-nucleotide adenylyltransferase